MAVICGSIRGHFGEAASIGVTKMTNSSFDNIPSKSSFSLVIVVERL